MEKKLLKSILFSFFSIISLFVLSGNTAIAQSVVATGTNSTCPNSASITATASGLANPIGYQLLQGGTIVRPIGGSGWGTSNLFTDLPAGTYTVKARGNNDDATIVTSAAVTVTETYTPITASVSPVSIKGCGGTTGALTVSAVGGSGNLSYGITPVGQISAPATFQSSATFSGLGAGSYKFWIKDNDCITSTIVNTTGVLNVTQPIPASDLKLDYAYLALQNTSTAASGYKIRASDFFTGDYVYMPADERAFYTVEVKNLSTGVTFPAQNYGSYTSSGSYTFPLGSVLPGQTLEYTIRNTCDGTSKTVSVSQLGPEAAAFATCGSAQAEYIVREVSLVAVPANFFFTDHGGTVPLHPENTKIVTVPVQNDGPLYTDFTPNTMVDWYVVDNDGKVWPGGTLDFTVDLTAGNTKANFKLSVADRCLPGQASIVVELQGVPQMVSGMTYEVLSSNSSVPVGHTGKLIPGPYNQDYFLEYSTGVNNWPTGAYRIKLHAPTPGGCYDNVELDVTASGFDANITGITKTATCGSFNFTVNGTFSNPTDYELIILSGPAATSGTIRYIDSNGIAQGFTNMPYGTYLVGLRVKGETCNLITLDPIEFSANSIIDFDALNSGGFACGPTGTGDLVVVASTVISGATLEYSIDNGANWQSSNIFPNVSVGSHPIRIRETACGTETTQNVTVIQTIQATINNNPISEIVCVGSNAVLNINAIGGTLYTWTYPDGSIHTGKVQNLTNVTPAMAGTYSVVVTTPSCVSPAQTVDLTVLTKPTVNAMSSQTACNGELKAIVFGGNKALSFSSATTSTELATIYSWSNDNPAIGLAASGTGDISFTGINTGSLPVVANITVIPGTLSGCPGSPQTFSITINPSVAKPTITGPASFCAAATATLTSSATAYNQWYKDGVAITGANAQTYVVTTSGSYSVAVSGNGTCSLPSDAVVLSETACTITASKTIVGNPASVKAGDALTYNITLTNSFGTDKSGVTV
ncbi:MAG: hypothetical protein EOP54_15200, partial [Sphingobacteriales bacterium]